MEYSGAIRGVSGGLNAFQKVSGTFQIDYWVSIAFQWVYEGSGDVSRCFKSFPKGSQEFQSVQREFQEHYNSMGLYTRNPLKALEIRFIKTP